jgi:hypothetical protein
LNIKIILAGLAFIFSIVSAFKENKGVTKWMLSGVGFFILLFSIWDIYLTNKNENDHKKKVDELSNQIRDSDRSDSIRYAKIDSSLREYNLKISGDSLIKLANKTSFNVKSENQKGGQTAGIINNH